MTRALTRTHLHSSRLMRTLADLALMDAAQAGTAFAEKLGQWMGLGQAITLHGALNALPVAIKAPAPLGLCGALGAEFARVRGSLESAVTSPPNPKAARGRSSMPAPDLLLPIEMPSAFEPYRRFYLAQQRDMELATGPLRAKARDVLIRTSSPLKTLATLDAALDSILNDRESKLLAHLPGLLEQRFSQLFKAHQLKLEGSGLTDNPAYWMHAGGWLARFRTDLQTVLLAELDLRLQPTVGLIEALNHETSTSL